MIFIAYRPMIVSRYKARLRATGTDWGHRTIMIL